MRKTLNKTFYHYEKWLSCFLSLLSLSFLQYIFLENLLSFPDLRSACLCPPAPTPRLRKIKQLTLSQDNWLWEAVTPSFKRDFRPPENLLTLLLAKCYVKAPLKPLSSIFSGKAWKYCKHLEFVFFSSRLSLLKAYHNLLLFRLTCLHVQVLRRTTQAHICNWSFVTLLILIKE